MKRVISGLFIVVSSFAYAGFVADEATWFAFTTSADFTYYIDPYQTEYLESGDVEILIERIKVGESKFANNPERLRFNCKTKQSYQSFALQEDGSWKKVNDYEIKKGSISMDWVNLSCGMKFNGVIGTYVGTNVFTEPTKYNRYVFWEKDRFYSTKVPNSKGIKLYELAPDQKGYFEHIAIINCKKKEFGYVNKTDEIPEKWESSGAKNTIFGYLTFKTCGVVR